MQRTHKYVFFFPLLAVEDQKPRRKPGKTETARTTRHATPPLSDRAALALEPRPIAKTQGFTGVDGDDGALLVEHRNQWETTLEAPGGSKSEKLEASEV